MIKGYRPHERKARRTADVSFAEGHEFHGFEGVVALTASLDFLLSVSGLGEYTADRQRELVRQFGDTILISWNVEDRHGQPVPADGEGYLAQENDLCMSVMGAWREAMTTPSAPLGQESINGLGSQEPPTGEQARS
jgi:hypothetical protein